MEEEAKKYEFLCKVNMKGMPDNNIWKMLYCWFESIDVGADIIHFWVRLLKALFHNYYSEGNGNIAFVYTNASGWVRQDHVQCFRNICSTQDEKIVVMPCKGHRLNNWAIKNLKYIRSWYKEGIRCGLQKKQAADFAVKVFRVKSEGDRIYELLGDAKYVVTYCDVLPQDYYVTYLANKYGKVSITVQHGFFPKGGYQFTHSESEFFITNTAVSYEFALNSRVKHPVAGGLMSEMFGKERTEMRNGGIFAVLLDGMNCNQHRHDNISMLESAELLAVEYNLKYIVRYHPADVGDVIHNENSNNLDCISTKTEKMEDLLNKVDFVIVNQSTTYFQSISTLVPAFRFIGTSEDTMPSIHMGSFSNYDELTSKFIEYMQMSINDMKKQKLTLIGATNIYNQYKDIFNWICEN